MTKLSLLTIFTAATLTSQLIIVPVHGQTVCSIPAQGKLEPSADIQKVQSPIDGVVKKVYVRNGDRVKAGSPLIQIEAERSSTLLTQLKTENQLYRSFLNSSATDESVQRPRLSNINLKPNIASLLISRDSLKAENRIIHAELSEVQTQSNVLLNFKEQNRLHRKNLVMQIDDAKSRILSDSARLKAEIGQIDYQIAQNSARIIATRKSLTTSQSILNDVKQAVEAGAISRVQFDRQEALVQKQSLELEQQIQEQEKISTERNELLINHNNYKKRQLELIKEHQTEISRLDLEFSKSIHSIGQNKRLLFAKISENEKRIAEIDSQINKIILSNEKKIFEIMNQKPKYQEVRSPIDGKVFELSKTPGLTVRSNSKQPLVLIVPDYYLIAKVYIVSKDISYVKNGMPVNVSIDSFPFDEFGYVQGTVESINPNPLPPDQTFNYYRFPAKIKLEKQSLNINQGGSAKDIRLQTGMSINANIQLQQCPR